MSACFEGNQVHFGMKNTYMPQGYVFSTTVRCFFGTTMGMSCDEGRQMKKAQNKRSECPEGLKRHQLSTMPMFAKADMTVTEFI